MKIVETTLLVAFIVIIAMGYAYSKITRQDASIMHTQMLTPAVRVSSEGSNSVGSGTVIWSQQVGEEYNTYVLTNNHVIMSSMTRDGEDLVSENLYVETFTYNNMLQYVSTTKRMGQVVAYDYDYDLALILLDDVETGTLPFATLSTTPTYIYEDVWMVGAGLGARPFPTSGYVSGTREMFGQEMLMTSASIISGNSGGALYHEVEGRYEMIGVPTAVPSYGMGVIVSHMGMSIQMVNIRKFLSENGYSFIYEDTQ